MLQRDDHDWRLTMLSAIREVQIPLLTVMLLGGCGAKAFRTLRTREIRAGLGPTALFPLRLRCPVAMGMCATELGLGVALLLTAGRAGAGLPATLVRAGTAVLFLIAVGALVELRERRPGAGCGCFGELSVTPVGVRTIARAALLATAALATIGQPPLRMAVSASEAELWIGLLTAELLLLAALSPEIGEAMIRLGYSEPCEVRLISVERTLAALGGSAQWRRYAPVVTSAAPVDIWREGCWRYLLFAGETGSRSVDVVFAVYLKSRRPQIRAAVLDAFTDEILTELPRRSRAVPEPLAAYGLAAEPSQFCGQPELDVARPLSAQQAADVPYPLDVTRHRAVSRPLAGLAAPPRGKALARQAGQRGSAPF
jgi:hypothetical protein